MTCVVSKGFTGFGTPVFGPDPDMSEYINLIKNPATFYYVAKTKERTKKPRQSFVKLIVTITPGAASKIEKMTFVTTLSVSDLRVSGSTFLVQFIKFSLKVHRADFIFNLPLTGAAINFLWAHKKLLPAEFFLRAYKT